MFWKPDVDVYSWNTFIAVNWPADTSTCQADTTQSIVSGPGSGVWETWALDSSVFVSPGSQPTSWCPPSIAGPRTFRHVATSSQLTERFPDLNEAFGAGPMRDQTGRLMEAQ